MSKTLNWSDDQEKMIRRDYQKKGAVYLANIFGYRHQAVQKKANRMGLKRAIKGSRPWSAKHIKLLTTLYPTTTPVAKIATLVGRSEHLVYKHASVLGLARPRPEPKPKAVVVPRVKKEKVARPPKAPKVKAARPVKPKPEPAVKPAMRKVRPLRSTTLTPTKAKKSQEPMIPREQQWYRFPLGSEEYKRGEKEYLARRPRRVL